MDHTDDFPSDPRSLPLPERLAWRDRLQHAQGHWSARLRALTDPAPGGDFPAFLLATPPLRGLVQRLGPARRRADLPTGVADELDRFVDAYRQYLRTCAGEDVFATGARRAG